MNADSKKDELDEIFSEDVVDTEEDPNHGEYFENISQAIQEKDPRHIEKKSAISGTRKNVNIAKEHSVATPRLSSGDIDADWKNDQNAGEEHSLGSVPTPDQDNPDEISEPWGLDYEDTEELDVDNKLKKKRRDSDLNG